MAAIDSPGIADLLKSRRKNGKQRMLALPAYVLIWGCLIGIAIYSQHDFNRHSRTATATITANRVVPVSQNTVQNITTLRWTPRDSRSPIEKQVVGNPDITVGHTTPVRYDARHPQHAYFGAETGPDYILLVVVFGTPFFFLSLVIALSGEDMRRNTDRIGKILNSADWETADIETWRFGVLGGQVTLMKPSQEEKPYVFQSKDEASILSPTLAFTSDLEVAMDPKGDCVTRPRDSLNLTLRKRPNKTRLRWLTWKCRRFAGQSPMVTALRDSAEPSVVPSGAT